MFEIMKTLGIGFENVQGVMPFSIEIKVHDRDYWQAHVLWTETNNE